MSKGFVFKDIIYNLASLYYSPLFTSCSHIHIFFFDSLGNTRLLYHRALQIRSVCQECSFLPWLAYSLRSLLRKACSKYPSQRRSFSINLYFKCLLFPLTPSLVPAVEQVLSNCSMNKWCSHTMKYYVVIKKNKILLYMELKKSSRYIFLHYIFKK